MVFIASLKWILNLNLQRHKLEQVNDLSRKLESKDLECGEIGETLTYLPYIYGWVQTGANIHNNVCADVLRGRNKE